MCVITWICIATTYLSCGPHNLSWQAVWGWARVWASVWLAGGVVRMELCICMFLHGCLCIFITLIFPMFFFPCGICPSLLLPSLSWSSCLQYYAVYSSICFFVFCCVFIILCENWVHEISVNSKIIVCCKWKITSFSVNFSILWQWMLQLWVGVWHHVGQLCAFSPLLIMCVQIWKHCLCVTNVSVLHFEYRFVHVSVAICQCDWIENK